MTSPISARLFALATIALACVVHYDSLLFAQAESIGSDQALRNGNLDEANDKNGPDAWIFAGSAPGRIAPVSPDVAAGLSSSYTRIKAR